MFRYLVRSSRQCRLPELGTARGGADVAHGCLVAPVGEVIRYARGAECVAADRRLDAGVGRAAAHYVRIDQKSAIICCERPASLITSKATARCPKPGCSCRGVAQKNRLYRRFKEVIGQAEEVAFLVALTGRGKSPAVSESAVRNAFNRGIRWAEKSHQS